MTMGFLSDNQSTRAAPVAHLQQRSKTMTRQQAKQAGEIIGLSMCSIMTLLIAHAALRAIAGLAHYL